MSLNIYKFYKEPKKLKFYDSIDIIPDVFFEKYDKNVDELKKREKFILKSSKYAYLYAKTVIKGRWEDAEPYIAKNYLYAFLYAKEVIQDRWPEAEKYIFDTPYYAYWYAKDVIKERWPEAEQYIIKEKNISFIMHNLF